MGTFWEKAEQVCFGDWTDQFKTAHRVYEALGEKLSPGEFFQDLLTMRAGWRNKVMSTCSGIAQAVEFDLFLNTDIYANPVTRWKEVENKLPDALKKFVLAD